MDKVALVAVVALPLLGRLPYRLPRQECGPILVQLCTESGPVADQRLMLHLHLVAAFRLLLVHGGVPYVGS